MKTSITLTIIFFTTFYTIQSYQLTGTWVMHQVIQNDQDFTTEHNPYNDRYIIFTTEGKFESGGKPFGKNTGKYRLDSEEGVLELDSDAGPEDDSKWKVALKGDTMLWSGIGSAWAEDFKLIHVRKK